MNHPLDHESRDTSRREAKAAAESAMIAKPGISYFLLAVPQPIPWIVFLLSYNFLETAADEKFHGVKAGLIHVAQDWMHHAGGHVMRPQTRITVTQRGVDDSDLVHADVPPKGRRQLKAITYVDGAKQAIDRFSA
jgi:hypothetical protein